MEWNRIHFKVTGSTNEDAFILGKNGQQAWTVCTADMQIRGKGRLDREWYSPSGSGLYASVLIRPSLSSNSEIGLLSFCAANSMTKALSDFGADVKIKWPNDLIINGKKICGILSSCEFNNGCLTYAVIGTGVNLKKGSYPAFLSDRATCLEEEGYRINTDKLLEHYISFLQREIRELEVCGYDGISAYYLDHCITVGSRVRVSGAVSLEGVAEGIDRDGALLVRDDRDILQVVHSGDVSVRGMAGYV